MKTKFQVGDKVEFAYDDITKTFLGLPNQDVFVVEKVDAALVPIDHPQDIKVEGCEHKFNGYWFSLIRR